MNIEASPTNLKENLQFLFMAAPIAIAVGMAQLIFSSQDPWWNAAYVGLRETTWISVAWGAAVGIALLLNAYLIAALMGVKDASWAFKGLAAIPPGPRSIWLLSSFAAVFEELLYRAALVPAIGVLFSAVLFTVAHVGTLVFAPNRRSGCAVALDLLVFGLAMGLLFEHFGLIACMVAHGIHNLIAFRLGMRAWEASHNEWLKAQQQPSTGTS